MKLRRFAFWFLAVLVGLLAAGCCCKETGKKAGAGTAAGPGPATTPEAPEEPKAPVARHAALAVNLAGAMAMFLVETWATKRAAVPISV